ncbi:EPF-type Cis2-His2 zinc finger transcription factor [Selaginella moellendorffii]|uniref:EPF-type Cis2-His2 zinc finger transcription factor n=1 Tax=Selaginella moellendorffii TaxID=88036 RepID=D8SDD3_SELML|nr:EPF-type Cis2-His2 zinc finger transcription factor [Selaginella moellendorffii]
MKFAKSQALGGHMNRHRQGMLTNFSGLNLCLTGANFDLGSYSLEREREQLLHARQLVLQQGLPW